MLLNKPDDSTFDFVFPIFFLSILPLALLKPDDFTSVDKFPRQGLILVTDRPF